jgi:hypothetical protein
MSGRQEGILYALFGVCCKHKKYYCWPSQKKILELMARYQDLGFSVRTLNRDLRWLEDNGYISRLRRIRVGCGGKLVFCSTLYKFKGKAFNFLNSLGNRVKRLFSFFRLPKLAHYQLQQEQASSSKAPSCVHKVRFVERNGSVCVYNTQTGEVE